eukprot:Skav228855  [mRNA]  locus=scaffold1718:207866:208597:+ [translate_table: standard]
MNVHGTAVLTPGCKMVIALEPAASSTAPPAYTAPPQPAHLLQQMANGTVPAHPSKKGLDQRRLQMQINNVQHRLNLAPGASGQWNASATEQLYFWLLKPTSKRTRADTPSPSPAMIMDGSPEPPALLDLPPADKDEIEATAPPPQNNPSATVANEIEDVADHDSDVPVDIAPAAAAPPSPVDSSSSSSSSSSATTTALNQVHDKIRKAKDALMELQDVVGDHGCDDCNRCLAHVQKLLDDALA